MVCSTDGYVSIVNFAPGELGEIYRIPTPVATEEKEASACSTVTATTASGSLSLAPSPTEEGPSPTPPPKDSSSPSKIILEAPPTKRAKKNRITPILISTAPILVRDKEEEKPFEQDGKSITSEGGNEKSHQVEAESVHVAVTQLSLDNTSIERPKKKKRIQPILVSSN